MTSTRQQPTDPITADAIRAHLHTAVFGKTLVVEPQLPSTNDTARQLAAAGAPEGTVIVADSQTAGRGRRGRTFFSPTGGIYLSILLRPALGTDPGDITTRAAVATARAMERCCGTEVGIKWVNDLYIRGRKVCGILTEGVPNARGALDYAVLGIGINVWGTSFPLDLRPIATSLEAEGCPVARATLIAALLEEWEHTYTAMPAEAVLAESRRRSVVLGKPLTVIRGRETFSATGVAIQQNGHLLVETPAGEKIELTSGEVSLTL